MRAFLAFEISPEVIRSILRLEGQVAETRADVKLVEESNIHITVKFLGEIPESAVAEIDRRISQLSLPKVGVVEVKGAGAFPNERYPRVIWVGLAGQGATRASESAVRVIKALEGIGQPEEDRAYHAHITIGRVRSPKNKEALAALLVRERDTVYGRTEIASLKLKSSVLTPKGAVYEDVREYELK